MEGVTPIELHLQIVSVIQEETGCSATWEQHPHPLRSSQLRQIGSRISDFIEFHLNRAIAEENREEHARAGRRVR